MAEPAYGDTLPPGRPAIVSDDGFAKVDLKGLTLVTSGRNRYFILEPGFRLTFRSEHGQLQITVLEDTVQIGEIMTRVVEEREWEHEELVEVSRNFFAICSKTRDVIYFGEEVDLYEDGKLAGHEGAWRAYAADAKPGMIMPGTAIPGMQYYQEVAPKVALDRAEVVSLTDSLDTPAGLFSECLTTEETSGLKPNEREFKHYAPGIGLIQDGDLLLVESGFVKK